MEFAEKGNCACCGKNLDRFLQPVVLDILWKEPLTGYGVVKRMEDYVTFEDSAPDPTGVYRYLKIMKEKGLISQDDRGDGGAPLYRITKESRECLRSWIQTLGAYASKIQRLTLRLG